MVTLVVALCGVGCDHGGVQVYQSPKDPTAARAEAVEAAPTTPPQVRWTLPSGWKELPAGDMRVGNFAVTGDNGQKAQVTVVPLAGQGGGDAENVNRWRGQVGQTRLSEAEIAQAAQPVAVAGSTGRLFDFVGKPLDGDKPTRLLAAILHREGTAWFFKMIGDDALVAAQKANFVAFLKTVEFTSGAAPASAELPPSHPPIGGAAPASAELPPSHPPIGGAAPASALPPSHPPVGGAAPSPAVPPSHPPIAGNAASPAEASGKPGWTVPAGWQELAPGPMQMAKFTIGSDAGKADVTVSALPGDAGGKLPNINRWRGQIGLPPVAEGELTKSLVPLEIAGAETYLVDLVAEQTKRRMVAAGVSRQGQTWFYKLVGDTAAVERAKEAFIQFVKTVKYGN